MWHCCCWLLGEPVSAGHPKELYQRHCWLAFGGMAMLLDGRARGQALGWRARTGSKGCEVEGEHCS